MLRMPALESVSVWGTGCERREREAPVMPETLLALLLRPETLETLSAKGILLPGKRVKRSE